MHADAFLADQQSRNTEWWREALRRKWSMQSEVTSHGFFVIAEAVDSEQMYGVHRVVDGVVEAATPHQLTRHVAFRRLRKLERQAS